MDWMAELFCERLPDSKPAKASREGGMESLGEAISSALKSAEASLGEWQAKEYKANGREIELRGDGPSNRGSLSIGAINDGKKRRAIEAASQDVEALKKLQEKVKTPEGLMWLSSLVLATLADAEKWFTNGTANVKTADFRGYFEYLILDRLGIKSAHGAIMSNGVSKALLKAVERSGQSGTQKCAAMHLESNA